MKVAIIAAMQEEMNHLKELLSSVQTHQEGPLTIFKGERRGHTIFLIQSGIGKVNAAIATNILIRDYRPDYVINTGVAGGYHRDLNILDLVLSTKLAYHDVDVTVFDYQRGQLPGKPLYFEADNHLLDIASQVDTAPHKAIPGVIYSGDSFIHTPDQVDFLQRHFPDAAAVEMEGAAIAHTCHQYGIPFLVIRAISDLVFTDESHKTYENKMEEAAIVSSQLIDQMLLKL